jgi:predicted PhzF superfamily epimerase YddE/YHI9
MARRFQQVETYFDMLGRTGYTYTANQGVEMGRNGFVEVAVCPSDLSIEIGGTSVTCIEGVLR